MCFFGASPSDNSRYAINGNKIREVDAEEKERLFVYDDNDNLIESVDTSGAITYFEYNSDDKLIKQTDPEGKIVTYEYDNEGRLIKTIDGNANEIVMEYDDATSSGCSSCAGGDSSQPSRIIYPTFTKEFVYDARGRKIEERDVLSDTETYSTYFDYDDASNLIAKTDKEGNVTQYEYDSLNRLKKVIDPLNQATEYVYDARDNLFSLKDANGNVTYFEYDGNNSLVREIRPMGEETTYIYDALGNLIEKTDAKGQITEYSYDYAGELIDVKYYNPDDLVNPVKTVSFTYDDVGNLLTYDDGTTSGAYVYDDAYRKTSETVDYGEFSKAYNYTYYNNGLKSSFTGPDGVTYSYTYDAKNQLAGIQIPGQGSITYTAYEWNLPANITLPGGSTKSYTYDPLMRVTNITTKDPGQNILLNYNYEYDKMDNILTKATEHGDYVYDYDNLYRLIKAESPIMDTESYTYDSVGNRLTLADTTSDWIYNQNNELETTDNKQYVYDANGNMISKVDDTGTTTYTYDVDNRLVQISNPQSQISNYYYDPFGRRLWKEVDGTTTYFMYSDEGLVAELDDTGSEIKTYGYVPNSTWTTDPLFMEEDDTYYFYHNDHLGTPQKMTAINGAVVWRAKYEAFGKVEVDITSTITNNLRFPGQYEDQEIGLYYNYYRYYEPDTGRYLRADPIGLEGGINLFAYVRNDPINLYDIMGLTTVGEVLDAYFSKSNNERIWIMGPNDKYTQKVRAWSSVQNAIQYGKNALTQDCNTWEQNHKTDPSWVPGRTDPPSTDPNAWGAWVSSPPGTDPGTAGRAFLIYKTTGIQTNALWTSAIGSFGIYITVDNIDCCEKNATLNIWMYNSMDRESFGRFADNWLFRNAGQARQYMWWNWKEKYSWGP